MESKQIFDVIKPGALTTLQDMGREGLQRFGVPVSGAMDKFAFQIANILAGNALNTACLEVTLIGPKLQAMASVTIAITGADLEPKINGAVKPMWSTIRINKGDVLEFGKHQSGVRSYIAVAGGFEGRTYFGSKSTDVKSGFGTPLESGTVISGYPSKEKKGIGLKKQYIPIYKKSVKVAVVEGPHIDSFTNEERKRFFNSTYTVDANSNRMGYRLKSKKITPVNADIWSDAVPLGGIQIPGNGQPIILMADRQTTGGYPRIGTVISADLSKVAQLVPKGEIRFYPVSVEEAQKRLVEMENFLSVLEIFRKYF
ncbi:allophanate hydrolase [Virgibacillus indicus]|uniref:Allophanate hydrolase n=1 Tax=Virgibacillus indicus TaxID=2024554 RepID=A0A265NAL4_9BACI|nr:biotin-dependent carboxyltransferase family protein [Virgibacillus indicus]OZU88825.1 allophanate hydrolase [Virgibacillus indicus]